MKKLLVATGLTLLFALSASAEPPHSSKVADYVVKHKGSIHTENFNIKNFNVGHENSYYMGSTSNQEGNFYHEGLLTLKTKDGTKISHDATLSKQDSLMQARRETTFYSSAATSVSHQVNSHVQYTNGTVTINRSSSIDKNHAPVIAYNGSVTINTQTGEKEYQGSLTKNL